MYFFSPEECAEEDSSRKAWARHPTGARPSAGPSSASLNIALKVLRCSQRGWASTSWPSWASDGVGRGEWALDADGANFLIGFYL